jgi:hypothetical protein
MGRAAPVVRVATRLPSPYAKKSSGHWQDDVLQLQEPISMSFNIGSIIFALIFAF